MAITVSLVNNERKIVVLTQPTTVKGKELPHNQEIHVY